MLPPLALTHQASSLELLTYAQLQPTSLNAIGGRSKDSPSFSTAVRLGGGAGGEEGRGSNSGTVVGRLVHQAATTVIRGIHLPYGSRLDVGGLIWAHLNHWSKAKARKGLAIPRR